MTMLANKTLLGSTLALTFASGGFVGYTAQDAGPTGPRRSRIVTFPRRFTATLIR